MRVLLADDHHLSRQGLRAMLEQDGILVVGEAVDHAGAVRAARVLAPDIVVLDLLMPGSPAEAIRRILEIDGDIRVLALTVTADAANVREALCAGAVGYLLKDTRREDLLAVIRQVHAGQAVLSQEALRALVSELPAPEPAGRDDLSAPELSARELQILRLIAEGASNETIGQSLSISRHTVKQHVSNICEVLGVNGRVQAAVKAVRDGLV